MGLLRKNETNNFKCRNITWLEYQLVEGEPIGYITKHGQGFKLGTTKNKICSSPEFSLFNKLAIRVGLEHRASELKVQHTKFLYQEKIDK